MKIIGHRGAGGLAPDNTIEAIKAGVAAGADFIEFDIRLTADKQMVLSHDENLKQAYDVNLRIANHTLKELRVPCPTLPTIKEALDHSKTEGVIIEVKDYIEPKRILAITSQYPKLDIRFASFNHHFIRDLKRISPKAFCYLLEHHSPFEIINFASKMNADGIGLHYSILNPLTYFLASRKGLRIYVYWLDNLLIARILARIYKNIDICTDYPNKMKQIR